jgi:FKBP-type peptidyl-prolyl cis-trans isomerase
MMKKNLMFLAIAVVGLASCNGGFKQGPAGLLYNIHIDKSGPKIKEGDFVSVSVVVKTEGDSVLMSTYEQGSRSNLVLRKTPPGDVMDVFPYLAEGDSATVKTNIDSAYKGRQKPPFKGKYIVYDIKVEKVIPHTKGADSVWGKQINAYLSTLSQAIKNAEPAKLKKYITDNKLQGTTTPSGLFYQVDKPGSGDKPAVGDTAEVYYTVKLLNNKIMETNIKEVAQKNNNYNPGLPYKPIRVPVGVKKMIPGWDEGLQLMSKGEKATFVIPSELAYGEQGNQGIPPYTPLVFNLEMVNIIHPDPNAPKPAPMQLQLNPNAMKPAQPVQTQPKGK